MTKINKNVLGITMAIFLGAMHAVWALAVAVNIGQKFLDFIFPMHFLSNVYSVMTFSFATALMLVVMATVCGYVMGWLFAALWNYVDKKV
ncbi:MAG: hypothetical protein WC254_04835 [Candidatus Woesearchaeota archaeon]|jgi:hypothetical protein